jgi:DNA-binding response OmpR family regulator
MELLDKEVPGSTALVIDGNPISRSVMTQNLREFGFGAVKSVGRLIDARELLEQRRFDVVICDYHFENSNESGQDLLEELRREQMLPYSTVFIMVTGEATYQKVAEAAETALDSYMIKPFSANALFLRVKESRQRKRLLKNIFVAMEQRDFDLAIGLCLERFEQRQIYWLYAARIGAELLLQQRRHDEATILYEAIVAAHAIPWARLGVARVQLANGDLSMARRTLEALTDDTPQYADSYDVLGKVQMEQGQIKQALETYRMAAEITPGCILRLQHCGTLAFYAGDTTTAVRMLERTWVMGSKSRLFDVLSMMLLAFLRFDAQDTRGLATCLEVLNRFASQYPKSLRLRRMAELGRLLTGLLEGRVAHHVIQARSLLETVQHPDFDMEAATNSLSLWARLTRYGVENEELSEVVARIGLRFSVSKASTEVLASAMYKYPEAEEWVRQTHVQVMHLAETAMNHSVRGEPAMAVSMLLVRGGDTGNAKLIEMATAVAQRHKERIPDVEALLVQATTLSHRYCQPMSHIAGVRRSNRSAGGMVLKR